MTQESAFIEFKQFLDKLEAGLSTDDLTDVITRMIPECEERLDLDDGFDDEGDDDDDMD